MLVEDFAVQHSGGIEVLDSGAIRVRARLARTGVQEYSSYPGREGAVRLYRPADEVFDPKSLDTLRSNPITVRHPQDGEVRASNWRERAVGHVESHEIKRAIVDGATDGHGEEFVEASLVIFDPATIDAIQRKELREFSSGYVMNVDWTPGVYKGEAYDGVQRGIRHNHQAILGANEARAGREARILDTRDAAVSNNERESLLRSALIALYPVDDDKPETRLWVSDVYPDSVVYERGGKLYRDGYTIEGTKVVLAQAPMQVVRSYATVDAKGKYMTLEEALKAINDAKAEIEKLKADHKKALDAKDAELGAALAKATPPAPALDAAHVEAAVAERIALVDVARPMLAKDYAYAGKTNKQIKLDAIKACRPDLAKTFGDSPSDGMVDGAFLTLADAKTVYVPEQKPTGDSNTNKSPKQLYLDAIEAAARASRGEK